MVIFSFERLTIESYHKIMVHSAKLMVAMFKPSMVDIKAGGSFCPATFEDEDPSSRYLILNKSVSRPDSSNSSLPLPIVRCKYKYLAELLRKDHCSVIAIPFHANEPRFNPRHP